MRLLLLALLVTSCLASKERSSLRSYGGGGVDTGLQVSYTAGTDITVHLAERSRELDHNLE